MGCKLVSLDPSRCRRRVPTNPLDRGGGVRSTRTHDAQLDVLESEIRTVSARDQSLAGQGATITRIRKFGDAGFGLWRFEKLGV
jgi:hypothetical protein